MRDFLDPYGFKMPEIVGTTAGFSAQYQTVYDSFAVKPAADIATQQDTMVRALVSAGVWATLDCFWMFANNDQTNAVLNWINPGTHDCLEVNAPVFTLYRGFQGNGGNKHLDTQYNPVNHAVNFAQNDASFGVYLRTDANEARVDMGYRGVGGDNEIWSRNVGNLTTRINDGTTTNNAVANSLGMFIVARGGANDKRSYKNTTQFSNVVGSAAFANLNFYILTQNNNGIPAAGNTKQASNAFIGGNLTQANVNSYVSIIETYMDYVGAGVI